MGQHVCSLKTNLSTDGCCSHISVCFEKHSNWVRTSSPLSNKENKKQKQKQRKQIQLSAIHFLMRWLSWLLNNKLKWQTSSYKKCELCVINYLIDWLVESKSLTEYWFWNMFDIHTGIAEKRNLVICQGEWASCSCSRRHLYKPQKKKNSIHLTNKIV